jgi:hypothetical protein
VTSNPDTILSGLSDAGVDFIVVGGFAAVMLGVPALTHDVGIVHRRTEAKVDVLLAWLLRHAAYNRFDLANRKLAPSRDALLGVGLLNLQLDIGPLDVLCTLDEGQGCDELLEHTVSFDREGTSLRVLDLPRLNQAKSNANRPKDRAVLPLLIATLDERNRQGGR